MGFSGSFYTLFTDAMRADAPEALLLKDPGLIATVILWLVSILWVFYL